VGGPGHVCCERETHAFCAEAFGEHTTAKGERGVRVWVGERLDVLVFVQAVPAESNYVF
jgi:hypothetical protein